MDGNGKLKNIENITSTRRPLEFEYREIKRTLTDFISIYSSGRLGANSAKQGTNSDTVSNFNIYGRLITKRKKGCSYYYSLLNANGKKDGWVRCGQKLEDDFFDEGMDWECNEYTVLKTVMQVLKTPYLNRLTQFYLRLIRNNLFFGKKKQNYYEH